MSANRAATLLTDDQRELYQTAGAISIRGEPQPNPSSHGIELAPAQLLSIPPPNRTKSNVPDQPASPNASSAPPDQKVIQLPEPTNSLQDVDRQQSFIRIRLQNPLVLRTTGFDYRTHYTTYELYYEFIQFLIKTQEQRAPLCTFSLRDLKEYFGQSNRASQTYSRNTRLITRYLTQARVIEHHTQTSEKKARLYTIKPNKLSRHLRPEVIFDGREFNSPITLARNIDTKARTSVSTQQVTT